jgi:hypothetical protein
MLGSPRPVLTVAPVQVAALCLLAACRGQPSEDDCRDQQFHVDPDNCPEGYYRCYPDGNVRSYHYLSFSTQGGWNIEQHICPTGTVFHEGAALPEPEMPPDLQVCDFPGTWVDDMCRDATHPPTEHPTAQVGLNYLACQLDIFSRHSRPMLLREGKWLSAIIGQLK